MIRAPKILQTHNIIYKRNNHIKMIKIFNNNNFIISQDKLLLANKHKLSIIIYIIINN